MEWSLYLYGYRYLCSHSDAVMYAFIPIYLLFFYVAFLLGWYFSLRTARLHRYTPHTAARAFHASGYAGRTWNTDDSHHT